MSRCVRLANALREAAPRAVASCNTADRVRRALELRPSRAKTLLAVGKAASTMAYGAIAVIGELGWLVVSKDEAEAPFGLHLLHAGHARLDESSVVATQRAVEPCRAQPADGESLEALRALTHRLLRTGATIDEMNDVQRRHGAALGGTLLRATRARVRALVVSDVLSGELRTTLPSPFHPDDPTPEEPARLHVELVASPQTLLDEAVTALTEFERRTARACVRGKRRSSSGSRRSR